jgi:hypothetical protein
MVGKGCNPRSEVVSYIAKAARIRDKGLMILVIIVVIPVAMQRIMDRIPNLGIKVSQSSLKCSQPLFPQKPISKPPDPERVSCSLCGRELQEVDGGQFASDASYHCP